MVGDILPVGSLPAPGQGPCASEIPRSAKSGKLLLCPMAGRRSRGCRRGCSPRWGERGYVQCGTDGTRPRRQQGKRDATLGTAMPVLSHPHPALPAWLARAGQAIQIASAIRISSRKARRLKERENPLERDRQPPPRPARCNPRVSGSERGGGSTPGTAQSSCPTPSHRCAPLRALHPPQERLPGSCALRPSKAARLGASPGKQRRP